MKDEKKYCKKHHKLVAPMSMAVLLEVKRDDNFKLITIPDYNLSEWEIEGMLRGEMAFKHVEYDTYCQSTCFTIK